MYLVYKLVDGNIIPTGEIKPLRAFEVDEIYLATEYGEDGVAEIPYKVVTKYKLGSSVIMRSERLGV